VRCSATSSIPLCIATGSALPGALRGTDGIAGPQFKPQNRPPTLALQIRPELWSPMDSICRTCRTAVQSEYAGAHGGQTLWPAPYGRWVELLFRRPRATGRASVLTDDRQPLRAGAAVAGGACPRRRQLGSRSIMTAGSDTSRSPLTWWAARCRPPRRMPRPCRRPEAGPPGSMSASPAPRKRSVPRRTRCCSIPLCHRADRHDPVHLFSWRFQYLAGAVNLPLA